MSIDYRVLVHTVMNVDQLINCYSSFGDGVVVCRSRQCVVQSARDGDASDIGALRASLGTQ